MSKVPLSSYFLGFSLRKIKIACEVGVQLVEEGFRLSYQVQRPPLIDRKKWNLDEVGLLDSNSDPQD